MLYYFVVSNVRLHILQYDLFCTLYKIALFIVVTFTESERSVPEKTVHGFVNPDLPKRVGIKRFSSAIKVGIYVKFALITRGNPVFVIQLNKSFPAPLRSATFLSVTRGLLHAGDGSGVGSVRILPFQCESKNGDGIAIVSSMESESQGSERFLFLLIPSLAIKCELVDRNRERKQKNQPIT